MEFIDKNDSISSKSFNAIVDKYVNNEQYRYDDLSRSDRIALRSILKAEQHSCCAYCMARLEPYEETTDHVIPKAASKEVYNKAMGRHFGKSLYRNDIFYQPDFNASLVGQYYPHSLAYGNLVLACDDCNEKKDQDIIIPVFFDASMAMVSYNEKGLLKVSPTDALPPNLMTWLNQSLFMLYRAMWRSAKLCGIKVSEIDSARKRPSDRLKFIDIMKNQLTTVKLKNDADSKLRSEAGWERFLQFKWFWSYYH